MSSHLQNEKMAILLVWLGPCVNALHCSTSISRIQPAIHKVHYPDRADMVSAVICRKSDGSIVRGSDNQTVR